METIASPLLRALFDVEISRVLLRADMPVFTIVDANAFYLKQTLTEGKEIKGKGLFQIFDPEKAGGGDVTLKNGLINAVKENRSVKLEPFKYDISSADGLEMITSWWDAEILPIRGNDGKPKYLLVTTQNVTDSILNAKLLADADKRERELNQQLAGMNEELAATNEELEASNEELLATITELSVSQGELQNINETLEVKISERIAELAKSESSLRSLVMTAHYPLMILRGRDWIIEIANQPLVNLWDRTIEEVTGRKLMDILPEIEDQPFPGFLRQVYDTGVGYGQEEQVFHYNAPTGPATKYVSFYYDPLRDENGEVAGIIVAANDITAQVHSRQQLEKSNQDQQALNEEFAAINEELAATIEELSASNEELVLAQKDIEYKNSELATSEGRFRALIRQAPVAICVIRAEDLMIQEVNDAYLELVGKERSAMEERTIWEAVPEAAGSYAPVMEEVIRTGITFSGREHELILIKNGIPENVFIDFIYEPVKENSGSVTAIMVLGIDVSDKVKARRSIEDVEERIRLAVDAAGIGTFDLNVPENTLVTSDRFNELYGFDSTQPRDEYLKIFHPDDLHLSKSAHLVARRTGKMFYEARLVMPDNSIKWMRVQGNLYFNKNKEPIRLLGTTLDITEFKRLQQQKDDFISIASHELKTPLTTLKASIQLLERLKDNPSAEAFPRLLEQSSRSMNKISELVEDLLNVSRMNEGQVKLNKKAFTVSQMLNDCCSHVRAIGKHELIIQGDEQLAVFADEHRIDQVVVNLVNNAVKYAPDSKNIYLVIEEKGEMAKISVKDNGPGISPEKLPYLFERYYRADESGMQVSGLGLGLYISADIIHRHDGQIGVESKPGEGSTFWFTLPLK